LFEANHFHRQKGEQGSMGSGQGELVGNLIILRIVDLHNYSHITKFNVGFCNIAIIGRP